MSQDYYSVLAQAMAGVRADQVHAREKVYEMARLALRKQLHREHIDWTTGNINWAGLAKEMSALNRAIQQIELEYARDTPLLSFSTGRQAHSDTRQPTAIGAVAVPEPVADAAAVPEPVDDLVLPENNDDDVPPRVIDGEILPPLERGERMRVRNDPLPPLAEFPGKPRPSVDSTPPAGRPPWRVSPWWIALATVTVIISGSVLYLVVVASQFRSVAPPNIVASAGPTALEASPSPSKEPKPPAGVPLPTAYGVYAIDHGKLSDLQALPIKVPDPRVGVSAMISAPSANTFKNGQLSFIIFRSDLIHSAPARATVRVVARVREELVSDANGSEKSVGTEGSWAIRSNAYEMTVAPVEGNPAMILIRPQTSDFSFPPGRYALVLKNVGYDFAVEGPITDLVQCLERSGTIEMPIYLECHKL